MLTLESRGLRSVSLIVGAIAVVWSTSLIVDGWKATRAPAGGTNAAPKPGRLSPREPRVINVVGTAKRHVQLDRLTWDATVSVHAADQATAMRLLSAKAKTLRDFLVAHDVAASDIEIGAPAGEPEVQAYNHRNLDGSVDERNRSTGFNATQRVGIRATDVARTLAALQDLALNDQLLGQLGEPACSYSSVEKLQEELIAAAQLDLRHRAATAAAESQGRLGPLVKTDPGSFGIDGGGIEACAHGSDAVANVNGLWLLDDPASLVID